MNSFAGDGMLDYLVWHLGYSNHRPTEIRKIWKKGRVLTERCLVKLNEGFLTFRITRS